MKKYIIYLSLAIFIASCSSSKKVSKTKIDDNIQIEQITKADSVSTKKDSTANSADIATIDTTSYVEIIHNDITEFNSEGNPIKKDQSVTVKYYNNGKSVTEHFTNTNVTTAKDSIKNSSNTDIKMDVNEDYDEKKDVNVLNSHSISLFWISIISLLLIILLCLIEYLLKKYRKCL